MYKQLQFVSWNSNKDIVLQEGFWELGSGWRNGALILLLNLVLMML